MKIAISLSLILFFITPLSGQDEERINNSLEKLEKEIWSLEEDYISYFKEANHKAILSLYHSQFLGWPDSELHPAGKKIAAIFLEEKYPKPTQALFNIKKEAIRVFEDVVITHYLLILSWTNDGGVEQTRVALECHGTRSRWNKTSTISNGFFTQKIYLHVFNAPSSWGIFHRFGFIVTLQRQDQTDKMVACSEYLMAIFLLLSPCCQ